MNASQPPDRWIDRWGHWVLWMGPYILIVSVLSWTPRFVLCLCAFELFQFAQHVRAHHPSHPMAPRTGLFVGVALAIYFVGSFFYPISLWAYLLMFCQVAFSAMVHDHFHGKSIGLLGLIGFGQTSIWWGVFLTIQGVVPGLPLLRPYLIPG